MESKIKRIPKKTLHFSKWVFSAVNTVRISLRPLYLDGERNLRVRYVKSNEQMKQSSAEFSQ